MTLDLAKVRADVKIRGMDIGLFRGVWPLEGWDYRRPVTTTEQSGNDLTYYQVLISLDSTNFNFAHAQSNGEDVRFTDVEGNLLSYWIEEWDAVNEKAKVWVKVPSIPANSRVEIYIYYGNPSASSASDASATFIRIIDELVASWHFDEGSGNITYDSSGNDNDGTIYGATWVDGKFGKALSFDGIDDYVDCGDSESLRLGTSDFTIAVWFKENTGVSSHGSLISKGTYAANGEYAIYVFNGDHIRYCFEGDCEHGDHTGLNDWQWHFMVSVQNGSVNRGYIDCELDAENTDMSVDITTNKHQGIGVRNLGVDGSTNLADAYFNGIIDEVFIFKRALSEEEILDLYNNYGYSTENYPGKVLVRKYTEPEPSVSVGEEETP